MEMDTDGQKQNKNRIEVVNGLNLKASKRLQRKDFERTPESSRVRSG
jgi:hypothetical protein